MMASRQLPSPEEMRQLIRYNPETGLLFWRRRPAHLFPKECAPASQEQVADLWNRKWSGKEALGGISARGYKYGSIKPHTLTAHRVAWVIFYGEWPSGQVDHINGNRIDNSIANLRVVNNSTNSKNQRLRLTNKSGVTGVYWNRQCQKWCAQITISGKTKSLGLFDGIEDAARARSEAELLAGFHPNHGKAR